MGEVLSRERLMDVASRARASGQSIALAAGVFDPFHVGHVRYLQASACEADVLVVAIQADPVAPAAESGSPILAAGHRADLIAALRCVDAVTLLEEPAVASLIDTLRPDVYCQDVGGTAEPRASAAAAAYGGRVTVVGDPDGPSAEDVRARIASGRTSAP